MSKQPDSDGKSGQSISDFIKSVGPIIFRLNIISVGSVLIEVSGPVVLDVGPETPHYRYRSQSHQYSPFEVFPLIPLAPPGHDNGA